MPGHLEVIDARPDRRAMIVTHELPVEDRQAWFSDATACDTLLDQLLASPAQRQFESFAELPASVEFARL